MDAVAQPLLDSIRQAQASTLANSYLAWSAAVYVFWCINFALLDRAPAPAQLQAHRNLLLELLTVGKTLEAKLKTVKGEDLNQFTIAVKASLTELEAAHLEPIGSVESYG